MAFEMEMRVDQHVGTLNWNFDELNNAVDKITAMYKGLVITDDQIKEAKEIRQALNKVKTEINNRRIDAKKEFCEPYLKFEEQVKIVTGKIEEVSNGIDIQIKDFENREKDAKYQKIEEWWNANCITSPQVKYEQVHDKRYLNKTCKDSDWKGLLRTKHGQICADLQAISNIEIQQKRDYVLSEYMKSLTLADALGKWEVYSEQLKQAEEFRRIAEEKAQRALEHMQNAQKQPITARKDERWGNTQQEQTVADNMIYERQFKVWGTREQIIALGNYMNQNGIKFKKVSE